MNCPIEISNAKVLLNKFIVEISDEMLMNIDCTDIDPPTIINKEYQDELEIILNGLEEIERRLWNGNEL